MYIKRLDFFYQKSLIDYLSDGELNYSQRSAIIDAFQNYADPPVEEIADRAGLIAVVARVVNNGDLNGSIRQFLSQSNAGIDGVRTYLQEEVLADLREELTQQILVADRRRAARAQVADKQARVDELRSEVDTKRLAALRAALPDATKSVEDASQKAAGLVQQAQEARDQRAIVPRGEVAIVPYKEGFLTIDQAEANLKTLDVRLEEILPEDLSDYDLDNLERLERALEAELGNFIPTRIGLPGDDGEVLSEEFRNRFNNVQARINTVRERAENYRERIAQRNLLLRREKQRQQLEAQDLYETQRARTLGAEQKAEAAAAERQRETKRADEAVKDVTNLQSAAEAAQSQVDQVTLVIETAQAIEGVILDGPFVDSDFIRNIDIVRVENGDPPAIGDVTDAEGGVNVIIGELKGYYYQLFISEEEGDLIQNIRELAERAFPEQIEEGDADDGKPDLAQNLAQTQWRSIFGNAIVGATYERREQEREEAARMLRAEAAILSVGLNNFRQYVDENGFVIRYPNEVDTLPEQDRGRAIQNFEQRVAELQTQQLRTYIDNLTLEELNKIMDANGRITIPRFALALNPAALNATRQEELVIGRQGGTDVNIKLNNQSVSRNHARIYRRGGRLYIVDTNSTNGTVLNGFRLTPNFELNLRPGDTIELGTEGDQTLRVGNDGEVIIDGKVYTVGADLGSETPVQAQNRRVLFAKIEQLRRQQPES